MVIRGARAELIAKGEPQQFTRRDVMASNSRGFVEPKLAARLAYAPADIKGALARAALEDLLEPLPVLL